MSFSFESCGIIFFVLWAESRGIGPDDNNVMIVVYEYIPLHFFESRGTPFPFFFFLFSFFLEDAYTTLEEANATYHVTYASLRPQYHRGVPRWHTLLLKTRTILEIHVRIFGRLLM